MKTLNWVLVKLVLLIFLITPSIAQADSFTKFLLHGDGTGSSFVDSSDSPHQITSSGGATQSTAQSKFGSSSIVLDGNDDFIHTENHSDFNLGSGDWTIDSWVRFNSLSNWNYIFNIAESGSYGTVLRVNSNGGLQFYWTNSIGWKIINQSLGGNLTTNTWYHLAVTRSGNIITAYVNGVATGSTVDISSFPDMYFDSSSKLWIGVGQNGNDNAYNPIDGYLDEFRLSKGIARWTSNFTPATAPYGSDTTPPVISIAGNASINHPVGTTYTDAGATATDDVDGTIPVNNISVSGLGFNTSVPGGPFTITYDVSDAAGNAATQVTRTVTVVDTTPPSIALLGNTSIAHPVGTAYTDPGATATDNIDGDITGNITVGGLGFNTSTPGGPFTITYNVSDAAGNTAPQVTRLVSVVDNTPPVISIIGSTTVDVFVGATYTDAGATASDNIDGDITGQIITTGLGFSTSVAGGPFTISYNVTDSAGNPAPTITRTVNVVDPAAFSCLTSGPIQVDETGDFTPVTIGSAFSTGGIEPVTVANDIPTSPLFSHFPVGDTIVTWTFTDALNRNAVCQQVITVNGTPGGGSGDDRIAITSLPFNIIGPGSYYFPSNLFFTATSGNAITINSSDVTIDFNGYNLIGPGIAVCACHGISMGNYRNVVIRNGTIKSFGGHGICNSATTSSGYRISKIRSHSNGLSGIYLEGSNHLVTQSAVYDNGGVGSGGFGIDLPGDGNSVTRSVVSNNNGGGINTGSASTVSHNGVGNNTGTGINTGSASTITHNGVSNNTGTGIIGVSGNTYSNNRVYSNTGSGMIGVSGNNYTNNNVYNNSGSGLTGGSGCSYVSNNIYNNTLSGIIAGLAARVKGNICYSNGHSGITAGNGSKVVDNTVYLNNTINSPSHAGIVATGRAIILSNTLSLNSKQNIHVSGDGNIVEDNTVSDSENGITFASGTNYSSGNKAFGNTNAAFSGSAQSPAAGECNANIDIAP